VLQDYLKLGVITEGFLKKQHISVTAIAITELSLVSLLPELVADKSETVALSAKTVMLTQNPKRIQQES